MEGTHQIMSKGSGKLSNGGSLLTYKNVYFHRMEMFEQRVDTSTNTVIKTPQDVSVLDQEIESIITNKAINDCLTLELGFNQETFEVLNITDKYIYARIGKMKDILTMQLRDRETLESATITKGAGQELEIFTYLLIDRKNYVISYLSEQSAPGVHKLENLIPAYSKNENLRIVVYAITVKDVLEILKKKTTISKIQYKISIPSSSILNIDELNLSENEYENYQNLSYTTIDVSLVGEPKKNIVKRFEQLGDLLKRVTNLPLGKSKQVTIYAKGTMENDYSHAYQLFGDSFCKKTKFKFDRDAVDSSKEIEQQLVTVYETNKSEILEFIS